MDSDGQQKICNLKSWKNRFVVIPFSSWLWDCRWLSNWNGFVAEMTYQFEISWGSVYQIFVVVYSDANYPNSRALMWLNVLLTFPRNRFAQVRLTKKSCFPLKSFNLLGKNFSFDFENHNPLHSRTSSVKHVHILRNTKTVIQSLQPNFKSAHRP